jgi:hypothetical protein
VHQLSIPELLPLCNHHHHHHACVMARCHVAHMRTSTCFASTSFTTQHKLHVGYAVPVWLPIAKVCFSCGSPPIGQASLTCCYRCVNLHISECPGYGHMSSRKFAHVVSRSDGLRQFQHEAQQRRWAGDGGRW